MRLSDAVSEDVPLAVHFPKGVLNVKYRPPAYTPAEMDELAKRERTAAALVESVRNLISWWDLTDDDGAPISLERPVPDGEDPLMHIPSNVYMAVIRAVNEDQNPGEASKP